MNQDFKDLLAAFNGRGVEFVVVGAHALAAHGYVRVVTAFAGEPAAVLSVENLIVNKRAAARPKDLADVARLEAMRRKNVL